MEPCVDRSGFTGLGIFDGEDPGCTWHRAAIRHSLSGAVTRRGSFGRKSRVYWKIRNRCRNGMTS